MTVYIEYVLINNFIIDYLILKATFYCVRMPIKKGRLLFLSLFLTATSLIFPLINAQPIILTLLKIAIGCLAVLVGVKSGARGYFLSLLSFFFWTFVFGGAVYGLTEIFNINRYSQVFTAVVGLPVIVVYFIGSRLVKLFSNKNSQKEFYYKTEIILNDKTITVNGFLDTGNGVYDGFTPCIFITLKTAERFFDNGLPKLGRVQINTVNGKDKKIALKNATVKIYSGDTANIHYNITLCVVDKSFDGYDAILHPALFGGIYVSKYDKQIKKVS